MHSLNLIKYWKGQHVINLSDKVLQNYLTQKKKMRLCNPDNLIWSPPDKTAVSSSTAVANNITSNSAMKKK